MAVLFGDSVEEDHAMVVDVTDGWLLQGGWLPPDPIGSFHLANARVSLMTAKLGVLLQDIQNAQGASGWLDHLRVLVDLGVEGRRRHRRRPSRSARPPSRRAPTSARTWCCATSAGISARRRSSRICGSPRRSSSPRSRSVQLEVEEVAFLNEDNGGRYLAFSGGVSIYAGAGQPDAQPPSPGRPVCRRTMQPRAAVCASGGCDCGPAAIQLAPSWLLDGVSLFISTGTFEISGSGTHHRRHPRRPPLPGVRTRPPAAVPGDGARISRSARNCTTAGSAGRRTISPTGCSASSCPTARWAPSICAASGCWSPAACRPTCPSRAAGRRRCACSVGISSSARRARSRCAATAPRQRGGWKVEMGAEAAGVGADLCLSVSKMLFLRSFIFLHTRRFRLRSAGRGRGVRAEGDAADRRRRHRGRPRSGQVERADRGRPRTGQAGQIRQLR